MTGRAGPLAPVSERLVAWIWAEQLVEPERLRTADGRRLVVHFPGRPWGEPGPDFQGAVLEQAGGERLRGDVEVHLRSSDWRAHGHQRDPAYNRTVLHVALRQTDDRPTLRADGRAVPLLELGPALARPLQDLAAAFVARSIRAAHHVWQSCQDDREAAASLLDRAGLERFGARSAGFQGDLAVASPEQVFHRGLLGALGYSGNKEPLLRLAEVATAEAAAWVARRFGRLGLEALLLGAAGLLPSQRGQGAQTGPGGDGDATGYVDALERRWYDLAPSIGLARLERRDWRLHRVRPANFPARRLAGAAALLAERSATDLLADTLDHLRAGARPAALADRFRVRAADAFWATHYDFDRPVASRPWLIGRARALEIVVNVLLPFAHALGETRSDGVLAGAALALYRTMPRTAGSRLVDEMARQVCGDRARAVVTTACRQQGLIHLFRRTCAGRCCDICPAGPARLRAGRSGR